MEQLSLANEVLMIEKAMRIASIAVGLVFTYAAASKLLDLPGFMAGIRAYNVIPVRLAPLAAGLLVVGEGFIAIAHVASIALQFVVPATIGLLLAFFIVMARLLKSGEQRPCLCFGASRDDLVDIYSLFRLALLLVAEVGLFFYLWLNDDSISLTMGMDDVYGSIVSVGVAAFAVVLIGWCLALPKIYRAWHVVRS